MRGRRQTGGFPNRFLGTSQVRVSLRKEEGPTALAGATDKTYEFLYTSTQAIFRRGSQLRCLSASDHDLSPPPHTPGICNRGAAAESARDRAAGRRDCARHRQGAAVTLG